MAWSEWSEAVWAWLPTDLRAVLRRVEFRVPDVWKTRESGWMWVASSSAVWAMASSRTVSQMTAGLFNNWWRVVLVARGPWKCWQVGAGHTCWAARLDSGVRFQVARMGIWRSVASRAKAWPTRPAPMMMKFKRSEEH